MEDKQTNFKEAYNHFLIKHIKSLAKDFIGIKTFFKTVNCFLFSKPGSAKEIAIKKKTAKILYALQNKKEIRENFSGISALMYRLKEHIGKQKAGLFH